MSAFNEFHITAGSSCTPLCDFYGWDMEFNKLGGSTDSTDIYRITLRLVTEQTYHDVTLVEQLTNNYSNVASQTVSMNGTDCNIAVGTNFTNWYTDSEDIILMEPKGSGFMTVRREFSSLGEWQELDFASIMPSGNGILPTASEETGYWFRNINYKSSVNYDNISAKTVATITQQEKRTRIAQVQLQKTFKTITNITPPSSTVASYDTISGIFNSTTVDTPIAYNKFAYPIYKMTYKLMGEALQPEGEPGSHTMNLISTFQCTGAEQTRDIYL
jgi:hypothetical protein